jgi:hypothetical protein
MGKQNLTENYKGLWRVHTANLLTEITNNPTAWVLRSPLLIFDDILRQVAQRAIELNDPELNKLMIRLTLYSVADPTSPDYDEKIVKEYLVNK